MTKLSDLRIFDNGGATIDRYTVVDTTTGAGEGYGGTGYYALGLSEDCDRPDGFAQTCDVYITPRLGKEIKLNDLPDNVRTYIRQRLAL